MINERAGGSVKFHMKRTSIMLWLIVVKGRFRNVQYTAEITSYLNLENMRVQVWHDNAFDGGLRSLVQSESVDQCDHVQQRQLQKNKSHWSRVAII